MMRETDTSPTREGLLQNEEGYRHSQEHAYASESDLDPDEPDNLEAGKKSPRLRGGWSPTRRKQKGVQNGNNGPPSKRKGGWFRNKKLMLIGAILLGGLIGVLGGVYGRAFKKIGLQDGVGLCAACCCILSYRECLVVAAMV